MGKMKKNQVPEFKMLNNRFKILIVIILYIVFMLLRNYDFSGFEVPILSEDIQDVLIPEGTAKMTFVDVGQGDSSIIQFGEYDVLIDAGEAEYGDDVVKKLEELGIDDIEYLVATHPHSDHIGGIPKVLENYEVENFVMPDIAHTTKAFENMIDLIDEKQINLIIPYEGQMLIDTDGASLKVISPVVKDDTNLNNYSICLKFDFGNTRAIYTGDVEARIENLIIDSGTILDSDIFQAGHHGSVTSNSEEFVNALTPQIVVVSCGKNNDYGHPHEEIVDRFNTFGSEIYRTDELSDITITTDGNEIKVIY